MHLQYGFPQEKSRMQIMANKHNNVTAAYWLLFKQLIKQGGDSKADIKNKNYNKKNFMLKRQQE